MRDPSHPILATLGAIMTFMGIVAHVGKVFKKIIDKGRNNFRTFIVLISVKIFDTILQKLIKILSQRI